MEGGSSGKKKKAAKSQDHDFAQLIFSWSLEDILNDNLYEHQLEKIPLTFQSEEHYFRSFVYPLLEETRTELASSMKMMYKAPFSEISSFKKAKGKEKTMYDVTVATWRNSERQKEPYQTLPGDLLILKNGEPGSVSDLQSVGSTWAFLLVNNTEDDDSGTPVQFKVTASQKIEFHDGMFVAFLMNITTQKRIWNSLHKHANLDIIKEILYPDSVVNERCDMCSLGCNSSIQRFDQSLVSKLNESQKAAIMAAISKMECCHKSSVEQIWGPPGTGKTMTVSMMLSIFLQMKCRTLTCAPTNVAIVAVASRVLSLVKESSKTVTASGDSFCSIGDLLLFGNKERLKVGKDIEEIYLDHRVEKLTECLGSLTGWKHCIKSMVDLLEDCVSQYHVFVENESMKEKQVTNENKSKTNNLKIKSFMEFVRVRFSSFVQPLKKCIITFCTHIPRSFMKQENFQTMVSLLDNLSSLESLLSQKSLVSEQLEKIFVSKPLEGDFVKSGDMSSINSVRIMSLSLLKRLQTSLGGLKLPGGNRHAIIRFCYERASLLFCTTSTSYALQKVKMEPLKLLVIDEAAQMKESEAIIPLQIPGMKHAILIGDECQLPATVKSNVSSECGLGRSLFERLSLLDHSKNLLNVQYRMHPKISSFPNRKFYQNKILDAENVTSKSHGKQYLSGKMFGSYSFINIVGGKEEGDDVGSKRNMVEVSIVVKIVQKLYKAWHKSKKKVSIGVVSPYAAQVASIEEKIRYKYEKRDGFSVTVKSIDGFQGGEEDIIILSTVRSNSHGNVGFMSSPQRTNVALTRARHCLWVLGNERTLARSDSIWKDLVFDARNRGCLFDANADKCLKKIIINAKKELEPLNDMVKGNSLLPKHVKWKILFSDNFRKSFGKLSDSCMKNVVVDFLQKLSGGWRPNDGNIDCKTSSKVLKTYKVEGLHLICTIDIIKELKYIQVLKVWDILPIKEIPKLRKQLESLFATYTDAYMNRCATKCLEGNLEIPKSWATSKAIIQFRDVIKCEDDNEVSENLLHMKFYSLSPGMVEYLRFGREIDLPVNLSDEQMDIFLYSKSSCIIGQLGTGKTTILIMKLLQNEQSFPAICKAESSRVKDAEVDDDHEERKPTVLRQLFVTVDPKSCYVVKQHVSQFKSVSCDGNSSREINLDDVDITSESDVPDTFIDVPEKSYPLVITFHKFLMMLDETLGDSFFTRFHEAREDSHGNHISSRSVALQTFIRSRNVTFDRFYSLYWPHFDSNLKKNLDPSRVFTEIMSQIKGSLQAGDNFDGKLSYEGYSLLSEGCASTLTKQKRDTISSLFEAYEKMKAERGDFDLGDLVNDLHHRLKTRGYEGDQMDFIYIDEVQDLSMRQISLFKYICQNVDEGFHFAGNTALNIARGVDFRFKDIQSMFHKEFLRTRSIEKQEKANVLEILQLQQNSRTHIGVLQLAQSVIYILYSYFAHSIDILEPETSFISGQAPVLLKSGNDTNGIVTIFGNTGTSEKTVSFGAEQVILVRNECEKIEICKDVGNQAVVLTIAECKGLEFQDVLLYNFFGSSPLKDQWSVIYGYMKEHDWLDEKLPHSFPSFKESKHNVLCDELKQLYVAITRTRQRLWICENKEELSKPMFDYWKKRGLVQVRKLNDSVVQAMGCSSSPQEWLECGKKLFYENIFDMATMCFERAGDLKWETMAKAFDRRKSAEEIRGKNPEKASCYLREAAEMFESIRKLELAAECYCDLGEYERAGKIYLDKCGDINAAAECFMLAGCYSDAAEAYAKGHQFSNCLSVCRKGELFDKSLKYVEYWNEHVHVQSREIDKDEQDFLEGCALYYYEPKDHKSMMKFVRAFHSMESKRVFLRWLGCLDDLMLLEEESGHFLDAAELAGSCGDVLKEADLLEKAAHFEEATLLILWYVFSNSLWGNGNLGWPLKHFSQKNELCKKAKSLAKMDSDNLYDFVCSEIKVLTTQQSSLSKLKKHLDASQQHKSLRGEILSIRKILDAHLQLDIVKYNWEDELPSDISKYVEDKISQNQVSVRTLVFYFNLWKNNVMDIFQSLGGLENAEANQHEGHLDFCLNYFGVRKQCVKGNIVYLLVNKDFDWVRNVGDDKGLHRDGKILTLDSKQLGLAIRSYWQSELHSVGVKVLETFQSLYNLTLKGSSFHQSTSLLHIFEVSKFLLDCQYLNLTVDDMKILQVFLGSSMIYFDYVFPLDWRKSVSWNLIALRESDLSLNLLEEVILQYLNIESDLSYWTIGRVMMICLSSRKSFALHEKIMRGLQWNPLWKSFVEKFQEGGFNDVYVAPSLHNAMVDTFRAYWMFPGHISPHSFVYLLDRLLFMASFSSGVFFTTKSSFVEWYTHLHTTCSTPDTAFSESKQIFSKDITDFLVGIVQHILYKKEETISWIERSNIVVSYYHPLIALKLVMIVALISLQLSDCSQVVFDLLLGWNNIAYLLPKKFVGDLLRRRNGCILSLNPDTVAEAFASIEDPLLIVSLDNATPRVHAPRAIFVDLKRPREEIMSVLFPGEFTVNCQKDKATMITEANHVEETCDEHSNGDHSLAESVLEKQSSNENMQGAEIKKGRQRTRGRRGKNNKTCNDQKQLSSPSDKSHHEVELSVSKSHEKATVQIHEWLQSSRPMVDCSNMCEVLNEENHVEETCDEHSIGDHSLYEQEVEKQNINNNYQHLGSKIGMGNNEKKKSKKNRSSNTQNIFSNVLLDGQTCAREGRTLHEAKNSWDDLTTLHEGNNSWGDLTTPPEARNSWDDLTTLPEAKNSWDDLTNLHEASKSWDDPATLQEGNNSWDDMKQPSYASNMSRPKVALPVTSSGKRRNVQATVERRRNESTQDAEIKKGKGKNKGKSPVKLVLEKQTTNKNTKDVKIKIGKGKNIDKGSKKNKGSNSVNSFTSDAHINDDHPQAKTVVAKQSSNENTPEVKIRKWKGENSKNKGINSVNSFTSDAHINDDHQQAKIVVEKQRSNENTPDAKIRKWKDKNPKNKGSNSQNTFTTVHVDEQHCVREATILQRANMACNDLNQSSSASNTSRPEMDLLVSKGDETTVETFVEKPMVDGVFNYVGSESSNITEALQEENHVEDTDHDEVNIGDHSPLELLLEKQTSNDNTLDEENRKGKGEYVAEEDTTPFTSNSTCSDLKPPTDTLDTGIKTSDEVKPASILDMAAAYLGIRSWRKT
ncbi:uncharacterized protein LOC111918090 isoform X2 [Lactuca sativa]|uniref:uncharacterized protein LOC111918090 isoform X2 n=1 Tax=Lactuca sativa TaxID=4236 RepID=UPI000CC4CBEB|nr:uncharacterized protein LOC111918090 isoform X2 [Lactuca sativa]